MTPEQIVKRPIFMTEKAANLREEDNQYIFEVDRGANKIQIKDAVEALFKVDVLSVNTLIMRGKIKRIGRTYLKTRNWKKAFVTLKDGESIDFFEGA